MDGKTETAPREPSRAAQFLRAFKDYIEAMPPPTRHGPREALLAMIEEDLGALREETAA